MEIKSNEIEQIPDDFSFKKDNKYKVTEKLIQKNKINLYQIITIILYFVVLTYISIFIPFSIHYHTEYNFIWSTNYNIDIKRYIIELIFITILFFSIFKSVSFLISPNYNDRKFKLKVKKELIIFSFISISMLFAYLYMYYTNINSDNIVFSPLKINLPIITLFCFYIFRLLYYLFRLLYKYLNS